MAAYNVLQCQLNESQVIFKLKKRLLKHKFPDILGVDGNCESGLAGSALEKLLWMPI